jgi:hypothetical protein
MKRIERVKRILKRHALLLSIVFSAGFGIGYYIALSFSKRKTRFTPNIKPYSNFISKELIIEIDCQRGVMKEKTLTVNFGEIINTAMMEEE